MAPTPSSNPPLFLLRNLETPVVVFPAFVLQLSRLQSLFKFQYPITHQDFIVLMLTIKAKCNAFLYGD